MVYKNHITPLLEWINDNIHLNLKIDDVAEKSGYSKWHLQRIFTLYTGMTLGAYIRTRRLISAAEDLANCYDSILEITLKYGYESQQSFTRTFSRYFNSPPASYRRQLRAIKK